jgi:asparagine N-glycosylation enzyme membrane subunit Stt3
MRTAVPVCCDSWLELISTVVILFTPVGFLHKRKTARTLILAVVKLLWSYPFYFSVRRLTNRKKRLLSSLLLLLAADAEIAGPLRGWLEGFFTLV